MTREERKLIKAFHAYAEAVRQLNETSAGHEVISASYDTPWLLDKEYDKASIHVRNENLDRLAEILGCEITATPNAVNNYTERKVIHNGVAIYALV